MAINSKTIQSNIKTNTASSMTDYALFMGGTNSTNAVLTQYDPAINGYYRLFMVKAPAFVEKAIPDKFRKFKHILEYANTGVSGIGNVTITEGNLGGGYTNRQFAMPTGISDSTQNIQISVPEFSGMPVHEVIDFWINGMLDKNSGFRHLNGVTGIDKIFANMSTEFIYALTDTTGENIEYACLLTAAYPTEIDVDNANGTAGTHELINYQITFNCNKYESLNINAVAKELIKKYNIVSNSMNFYSGYSTSDISGLDSGKSFAVGTNDGKFAANNTATTTPTV